MFKFENHGFTKLVSCYEYSCKLRKSLRERFDPDQVDEILKENQGYLESLYPEPSENLPSETVCAASRCIAETVRNGYADLVIFTSFITDTNQFHDVLDYLRENGVRRVVLALNAETNDYLLRAINHGWQVTGTSFCTEDNEFLKYREYKGVVLTYKGSAPI